MEMTGVAADDNERGKVEFCVRERKNGENNDKNALMAWKIICVLAASRCYYAILRRIFRLLACLGDDVVFCVSRTDRYMDIKKFQVPYLCSFYSDSQFFIVL